MQTIETDNIQSLMDALEPIQTLDEALYKSLLKQTKNLQKQVVSQKIVQKAPLKANTTLSKKHKKYLYKLAKRLLKLMKRDDMSDEMKRELLESVNTITAHLDEADKRDKSFMSEHVKQVVSVSSLAVMVVATLYGVKTNKK